MAGTSLHTFSVMTLKMISPELLAPLTTHKIPAKKCIFLTRYGLLENSAMSQKLISPNFRYVMILSGGETWLVRKQPW